MRKEGGTWISTFCVKSPRATAVVTPAIERTWSVRDEHILLTFRVSSSQTPSTSGTTAYSSSIASARMRWDRGGMDVLDRPGYPASRLPMLRV